MNTTAEQARAEAVLSEYDFIVCIDTSGSMGEDVKTGGSGRSRWQAVQESAISFARDLEKIDSDGIDLVLFGNTVTSYKGVNADAVARAFAEHSPRGSTPLAEALEAALKMKKGDKKDFIIVFTDGVPDDKDKAAKVIKDQSNRQKTDEECTFLFIQVGDNKEATDYLEMLDEHLKGAQFDIVNTQTVEQANKFNSTAELVLYAIAH